MNCIGALTASRRMGRDEGVDLLTEAELLRIERQTSLPRQTFSSKQGIHEWNVEMKIPFSLIMGMSDEEWREKGMPHPALLSCNLYKCGDETAHPHFVSWSPIKSEHPDFHRPEYFGLIVLAF